MDGYGLESQLEQHERDAESLVMEYGISLSTARQAVHRLGLSGTVVLLHAVAKDDPKYQEFDRAFPRIERMIPPIRRAIKHFSGTGLASGQVIDLVIAHGDAVYSPSFSLELALEQMGTEAFMRQDVSRMSVDRAYSEEEGAVPEVDEKETCSYAKIAGDCNLADCPKTEIPLSCIGNYKPLLNLLGMSEIREFETVGNNPEADPVLTKFQNQEG